MSSGGNEIQGLSWAWALAILAAAASAFLLLLASGATTSRSYAGVACNNADARIDEASGKELRRALICLINEKRRERDRPVLDSNGDLKEAANKHNKAMLRENCFAHDCPNEPSLGQRVRRSGYLQGARRWRYAENIGCAATPRALLRIWMQNDFARQNILNRVFRDIGAGAVKDQVPRSRCDTGNEVTYTVVFARRKG
jgi:uncharacterized protein YkwD